MQLDELGRPIDIADTSSALGWILNDYGTLRPATFAEREEFAVKHGRMPTVSNRWEMILSDIHVEKEPPPLPPIKVEDLIRDLDVGIEMNDLPSSQLHGYDTPPDTTMLEMLSMLESPMPEIPQSILEGIQNFGSPIMPEEAFEPQPIRGYNITGSHRRNNPHMNLTDVLPRMDDTWDMI